MSFGQASSRAGAEASSTDLRTSNHLTGLRVARSLDKLGVIDEIFNELSKIDGFRPSERFKPDNGLACTFFSMRSRYFLPDAFPNTENGIKNYLGVKLPGLFQAISTQVDSIDTFGYSKRPYVALVVSGLNQEHIQTKTILKNATIDPLYIESHITLGKAVSKCVADEAIERLKPYTPAPVTFYGADVMLQNLS